MDPLAAKDEFDHRDINNIQMVEKQKKKKKNIGPIFNNIIVAGEDKLFCNKNMSSTAFQWKEH